MDVLFGLKREHMNDEIVPHVVSSLLQTLPLMAPNLEKFSCEIDIRLGHEYLEAFSHLARLKTLTIHSEDALDESALRILSAIATLQDLTCTIDRSSSSALTLRPHTFPHLTSLNVLGRFDDLTTVIGASNLPSLKGLTLRVKEPPGAGKPVDSFAAICRRCNPALLTSFTVGIKFAFTANWPRPSRLLEYFEPVLAFPNIKSFHLSFFYARPSIHDDDLARCGAAWRSLSRFHVSHTLLGQDAPGPRDPEFARPTLSGLVDLARRCPHLETFRVPELDVNVVPDTSAALPIGHGLQTFWLEDVVLPAPESTLYREAATVFDRVFPSIDLNDARSIMSHAKEWGEFLGVLDGMRLGRAALEVADVLA
ncbi:hypothetical protein GSI_04827 [Ganoderma sinense ZZ0214-1]|uniref:F-box domain-containing protein n=1 Tax=Ganoderma sinense ZZ0214-1 TaxID=1077348 RepID=A0A2G8SG32_9APHY|nr:hypothetical protein GSI_04827 [Ganoderma sinense ZZ0214-1]